MTREEAIHVVKNNWPEGRYMLSEALQTLIPELKESDDEKIRKALIEYFQVDGYLCTNIPTKDIRAWLEKQKSNVDNANKEYWRGYREGKQEILDKYAELEKEGKLNFTEKVEPKFKVGDWIISDEAHEDYRICKIIEVGNGNYKIESIHGYIGYYNCKVFDSIYRLWTIEDAKSGDVLANDSGSICIFDGTVEDGIYPFAYCGFIYRFEIYDRKVPFTHENSIHPAAKEQRDLLFQKMHEAGYEWNAEKKELKKIEQEPVDLPKGEGYQADDGILEHKCAINAVGELCEQKPAEQFAIEHGKFYYCIKDYFSGGRKCASRGDVVQALRGLSMMGLTSEEAAVYFRPVNKIEQKSTE